MFFISDLISFLNDSHIFWMILISWCWNTFNRFIVFRRSNSWDILRTLWSFHIILTSSLIILFLIQILALIFTFFSHISHWNFQSLILLTINKIIFFSQFTLFVLLIFISFYIAFIHVSSLFLFIFWLMTLNIILDLLEYFLIDIDGIFMKI